MAVDNGGGGGGDEGGPDPLSPSPPLFSEPFLFSTRNRPRSKKWAPPRLVWRERESGCSAETPINSDDDAGWNSYINDVKTLESDFNSDG